MELTTSWKEEGRQEGEAEVVLSQLRRRFGNLTPPLAQPVCALPVGQLEKLAEALLDFTSPADLEPWLHGG